MKASKGATLLKKEISLMVEKNTFGLRHFPDELKKRIIKEKELNEISNINFEIYLNISSGSICKWKRKFFGQSTSARSINQTTDDVIRQQAVNLVLYGGETLTQVAEKYNTTKQTLSRWVQDLTGAMKKPGRSQGLIKIDRIDNKPAGIRGVETNKASDKLLGIEKTVEIPIQSIHQQAATVALLSTEVKKLEEILLIKKTELKELLFEEHMKNVG